MRRSLALERQSVTVPKRRGLATPCRGTWGSPRVSQEAEGVRRNTCKARQGEPVLSWLV